MTVKKPSPAKFNLRLPPAHLAKYQAQAEAKGVSLNAYCLMALDAFAVTARLHTLVERPAATPLPRQSTAPATSLPKVGRNDLCPCGSGKKAKACHPSRC